jgi:hypothetical protein
VLFYLTRIPNNSPYERGTEPSRQPYFKNAEIIDSLIPDFDWDKGCSNILAAWGNDIANDFTSRYALFQILSTLDKKKHIVWVKLGELTKMGHPRNIKGAPYGLNLTHLDIENYIKRLSNWFYEL